MRPVTKQCLFICGGLLVFASACKAGDEDSGPGKIIYDTFEPPSNNQTTPPVNNHITIAPVERPSDLPLFDNSVEQPETRPVGSEDLIVLGAATAVASDASTDSVYIVDLRQNKLTHTVEFGQGAWPSRLAATSDGQGVYTVLRGTGEIAKIDLTGQITHRAHVCKAPRGVAMDETRDKVWVSCASSEVVSFSPESLDRIDTFYVESDLRDIVATPKGLYVARFRAAEVLNIEPASGGLRARHGAPGFEGDGLDRRTSTLWRMTSNSEGNLILSYQESSSRPLILMEPRPEDDNMPPRGGYGAGGVCGSGVVSTLIGMVTLDDQGSVDQMLHDCNFGGSLPVDIDDAGCNIGMTLSAAPVIAEQNAEVPANNMVIGDPSCPTVHTPPSEHTKLAAAVVKRGENDILHLVLTRGESLYISSAEAGFGADVITLVEDSPAHIGHTLFHGNTGTGIACASCHPEGGDDGQPWNFFKIDARDDANAEFTRRTQNLRGGLEGKLHWDGEFDNITGLMNDVFSSRMNGFEIVEQDADAIEHWLAQLEPETGVTPAPDLQFLATRGEQLFESTGCAGCHSGAMFTDYQFYDVGTGGMRKTPTLRGVANKTRLMSDGCGYSFMDRFHEPCGGGDMHGDTANLSTEDKDALIAYLQTL
jgi:cytochrome c553